MIDEDDQEPVVNVADILRPDQEFEDLVKGLTPLPGGNHRDVFIHPNDTTRVIKRAKYDFAGANLIEWFVWAGVKADHRAKLFAPCYQISHTGRFLVMQRLDKLTKDRWADAPVMPVWFTDPKPENFGILDGEVRCLDYGTIKWPDWLNTADGPPMTWQMNAKRERDGW